MKRDIYAQVHFPHRDVVGNATKCMCRKMFYSNNDVPSHSILQSAQLGGHV